MLRRQRPLVLWIILFSIPFLAIEGRSFYLQIVEGNFFRERLADRSTLLELTFPLRGRMVDRAGRLLADNRYQYSLEAPLALFLKGNAPQRTAFIQKFSQAYGLDEQALLQTIEEATQAFFRRRASENPHAKTAPNTPQTLLRISDSLSDSSLVYRYELARKVYPSVSLQTHVERVYPYGSVAAHVLGYVGFIEQGEKEKLLASLRQALEAQDIPEEALSGLDQSGHLDERFHGRLGVEARYNALLAGRPGVLERNAFLAPASSRKNQGSFSGEQDSSYTVLIPEQPGQNITLTFDADFQTAVQRTMEQLLSARDLKGSFVMMDAATGDILSLVSVPGFDPNRLSPYSLDRDLSALSDLGKPLLNRAVSGVYPPGSIFKLVGALEALQSQRITPATRFTCPGYYATPSRTFHCWDRSGHGTLTVSQALEHSCDVFFWTLGKRLSDAQLLSMGTRLHLGQKTGIDLPFEAAGFWPAPSSGSMLDFLNHVIGQGNIALTPLQLTALMALVANRGTWVRPRISLQSPVLKTNVGLDPAVWDPVWRGLWAVVHAPGGTAYHSGLQSMAVWGKTSTAQISGGQKSVTHASFCGFFPKEALTRKKSQWNPRAEAWDEDSGSVEEPSRISEGESPPDPEAWRREMMKTSNQRHWISFCLHVEQGGAGSKVAARFSRTLLDIYSRFY